MKLIDTNDNVYVADLTFQNVTGSETMQYVAMKAQQGLWTVDWHTGHLLTNFEGVEALFKRMAELGARIVEANREEFLTRIERKLSHG